MKTIKKRSSGKVRRNYYEILKVLPNASYETLWIAFETLLKDLKSPGDENRTSSSPKSPDDEKLLREAITVLSDPDTRKVYDRTMGFAGANGVPSAGAKKGGKDQPREVDPYEEAVGRLVSGEIEEALDCFLSLYRSGEAESRIVEMIALCHRLAGRPAEAIPFYRMAIAADPDHIGNRVYLAELHLEMDDDEGAGRILEEAVEIGETIHEEGRASTDDLMALGDAYYLLGEAEAAADVLTEALEGVRDDDGRLEILERLAEVFYEGGFLRDCLETCGKVLELSPSSAEANLILGLTYYNCNLLGPASRHLRKSRAIDRSQDEIDLVLEEISKARAEAKGRTLEERIYFSRAVKRHLGMIKWFDDQEGSGVISGPGGEPVVLHYLSMLGEPDVISEGDAVSYGILKFNGEKIAVAVRKENPLAPGDASQALSTGTLSSEPVSRLLGRVADPPGGGGYTEIEFDSGRAVLLHSGADSGLVEKLKPGVRVEFTPVKIDGGDGDGPWLVTDPVVKE